MISLLALSLQGAAQQRSEKKADSNRTASMMPEASIWGTPSAVRTTLSPMPLQIVQEEPSDEEIRRRILGTLSPSRGFLWVSYLTLSSQRRSTIPMAHGQRSTAK